MFCSISVWSQDSDREVIIIEKTVDQDGNIISKNIERRSGDISDKELDQLLEGGDEMTRGLFDRFGGGLQELWNTPSNNQKPTLGVVLTENNGQLIVQEVSPRSGAEEADIRTDDKIISVQKIPVSTVSEIQNIIGEMQNGTTVDVVIWRDGQEYTKSVTLRQNRFRNLGSLTVPQSSFRFFGDGEGMSIDVDSLMRMFKDMGPGLFDMEGMGFEELFDLTDRYDRAQPKKADKFDDNRAQLGVFIDDRSEGVVITEIMPDGAARKAGLKVDDIILSFDDNDISDYDDLSAWIQTKRSGDQAVIKIRRGKKTKMITVDF